jgi:hypothetical protein
MKEEFLHIVRSVFVMALWCALARVWEMLGGPPYDEGFLLFVAGAAAISITQRKVPRT